MIVKRLLSLFVATSILFTGSIQIAQAAMVSSEQVAQSAGIASAEQDRERIYAALTREDVRSELIKRGVDPLQVEQRVAALTDEEASKMANQIENAPAGGIIGAIVFIFVLLLITDILGFTKVYPFTRSVR
ncbi:PA2779 family protein [Methylobacillus flagellatus]|uniref:PA2779 family protein n=1 Tax=Methylobacillus flagellatus TaxID=405 RepID=UPI002570C9E7|nr:PA2779 family protein [Methylobacillus flagellatus]